jgi:hypothetical protein
LPRDMGGRFPPPIDAEPIGLWGESVRSFGGMYYTEDGQRLVVLFTDDPELHRVEVSRLTSAPERLILRRTSRSRVEVDEANRAAQRKLLTGVTPHPSVVAVGMTLVGDEWVVHVGIDPYSDQTAAEVRELVAPEHVVVDYQETPTEW